MDRELVGKATTVTSCPHRRGGGPRRSTRRKRTWTLSPQAWGWTEDRVHGHLGFHVVPTGVGVDRDHHPHPRRHRRCPHRRGGGPDFFDDLYDFLKLSPQAWGWTAYPLYLLVREHVVPTGVGVDRASRLAAGRGNRCPHRRGGGPKKERRFIEIAHVVPTGVGVDRVSSILHLHEDCCPHRRGGGPAFAARCSM